MATVESNERWKKENTLFVGLRLMKKTDMDIIEALGDDPKKQPRVRELLRLGIEYERLQKEGQPLPQEKPMPLRPVVQRSPVSDKKRGLSHDR